ncbi:hypothetical protein GCM10007079_10630 [Nocardiopsis terrae]|nr:hypothetical protein GCM10007079_10630 [Nocardiopsis terrae]
MREGRRDDPPLGKRSEAAHQDEAEHGGAEQQVEQEPGPGAVRIEEVGERPLWVVGHGPTLPNGPRAREGGMTDGP